MIVIDGQNSGLSLNNFGNLEELLVKVMEEGTLDNRIVTDVLVNEENFSEIYPHQAEDIETSDIEKVEIISMPVEDMAVNMTNELHKVIKLMAHGGKHVADLFRQADDAEALEVYQDLIDVTRDFLSMINVLRNEFAIEDNDDFNKAVEEISELFTEMSEVMENEDWILLADVLEYDFLPVTGRWEKVITNISQDLDTSR